MSLAETYEDYLRGFTQAQVAIDGLDTTIYTAPPRPGLPTYLFVHGVSGSHYGLVPLAYELRDDINIAFVDLPGHVASELPTDHSLSRIAAWASALIPAFASRGVQIDGALGHSFGCYVVAASGVANAILCDPPFASRLRARLYARGVFWARYLLQSSYQTYGWAIWRGKFLIHRLTTQVMDRLKWIASKEIVDTDRFLYQKRLEYLMTWPFLTPAMIRPTTHLCFVTSKRDSVLLPLPTAVRQAFPAANYTIVPTNHTSVIEQPEAVANAVRAFVKG